MVKEIGILTAFEIHKAKQTSKVSTPKIGFPDGRYVQRISLILKFCFYQVLITPGRSDNQGTDSSRTYWFAPNKNHVNFQL